MVCIRNPSPSSSSSTTITMQNSSRTVISLRRKGAGDFFVPETHTQSPHVVAIWSTKWRSQVRANERLSPNCRILLKARIQGRIRNMHRLALLNGMRAEGYLPRCSGNIDTHARLEPLAIAVNQRHRADRNIHHRFYQVSDSVEPSFFGGIKHFITTTARPVSLPHPSVFRQSYSPLQDF